MADFWLSAVAQPSAIDSTAFHAFEGSCIHQRWEIQLSKKPPKTHSKLVFKVHRMNIKMSMILRLIISKIVRNSYI